MWNREGVATVLLPCVHEVVRVHMLVGYSNGTLPCTVRPETFQIRRKNGTAPDFLNEEEGMGGREVEKGISHRSLDSNPKHAPERERRTLRTHGSKRRDAAHSAG